MWESLLASSWASLAVLPTDAGTSVTLVTEALGVVAARHPKGSLRLVDAQGATVAQGEELTREVASAVAGGARVVVVIDSVMWSLAGVPLLRASDYVLLVVRVGAADPEGLTSTIGIVGHDRIMGSVAVPSDG